MNFNFSSKCSSLKVILTLNNVLKSLCFCEKFESWANGHKREHMAQVRVFIILNINSAI